MFIKRLICARGTKRLKSCGGASSLLNTGKIAALISEMKRYKALWEYITGDLTQLAVKGALLRREYWAEIRKMTKRGGRDFLSKSLLFEGLKETSVTGTELGGGGSMVWNNLEVFQRPDHADFVGYGKNFGFPRATWDATQRVLGVSGDMLRLAFWKGHSGFWIENGPEGQALWVRDMVTWIKEVVERSCVNVTFCIPGHLLCARPHASCWRYKE